MSRDALTQRRRGAESSVAKQVRLGDVCELNMGQSPESASYNTVNEGLPFYQGNADFGPIYPTPRVWCNSPVKIAEAGDLLVSVRAPIGALNFANERCCIGRGLAALRVKPDSDSKFIYYALKSNVTELNARGTGSTFKAINKKALSNLLFPLPPLAEQRRITAKLDRICDIVVKRKQQLVQLQQLVKSRFVEMFESASSKTWESKPVEEICELIADCPHTTAQDEGVGYPLVRTPNIGKGRLIYDKIHRVSEKVYNLRNKRAVPRERDLILAREAPAGNIAVIQKEEKVCLGQRTVLLRPRLAVIDSEYMAYRILSEKVQRAILDYSSGSTVAHLNVREIRKLKLPIPPPALQREFAAFVAKVDKLAFAVRKSLESAEKLYRQQLSEAFA